MLRDKERDIVRAVLPSCARKWARHKGRYIARARRRAEKEALLYLDPEDWDDSKAYRHVGNRLSRLRSDECWRISERRNADKLGSLKRWTKYHQRTSDNDEEAYEKVCKVLEPGRNLITRHAVEHAESWLDLKKDQYRYSWGYKLAYSEPFVTMNNILEMVTTLFETQHKKLNRCLKQGSLNIRPCKDKDPCSQFKTYTSQVYEYYDSTARKWVGVGYSHYLRIQDLKRVRNVERKWAFHNWKICPNKCLVRSRKDLEAAAEALYQGARYRNRGYSLDALQKLKKDGAIYRVLQLAKFQGILRMAGRVL